MLDRILTGMRPYFGTTSDMAMVTTGDRQADAAVVNTLSPGDRVLGVSIGSFGDRFAKIAGIYGADVTKLDAEWGYAAAPADPRAPPGDPDAGRPAHPQRDLDRGDEPDPRARRGDPRGRPDALSSSTRSRRWVPCRSRWTRGASTWSSPVRRRRGCRRPGCR